MALRSRLAAASAAEPAGRGVCHPRPAGPRAAPLARRVDVRAGLAVPLPADRNQRLAEGLRRTPGVLNEALTRLSSSLERKECPTVQTVHSATELEAILTAHPHTVVVLMCKSGHCRPCKMFARKYSRIAESLPDAIFLEILGDESSDTRRLMMKMDIRVTPTFKLFHRGEVVQTVTGINETTLRSAVETLTTEKAAK